MLKTYWLDLVDEAQPLWMVLAEEPESLAANYMTPLLGLVVMALRIRRHGARRADILVTLFLLAAVAVSIWQVRGSRFSVPLAIVPLAIWVAEWRRRGEARPGLAASIAPGRRMAGLVQR